MTLPITALGQNATGGYSRIQGVDKEKDAKPQRSDDLTIEYREEMRLFVQKV